MKRALVCFLQLQRNTYIASHVELLALTLCSVYLVLCAENLRKKAWLAPLLPNDNRLQTFGKSLPACVYPELPSQGPTPHARAAKRKRGLHKAGVDDDVDDPDTEDVTDDPPSEDDAQEQDEQGTRHTMKSGIVR